MAKNGSLEISPQFLTDREGNKVAVQLTIAEYTFLLNALQRDVSEKESSLLFRQLKQALAEVSDMRSGKLEKMTAQQLLHEL